MNSKRIITSIPFLITSILLFIGCQPSSPTLADLPQGEGAEWHLVVIGESSSWGLGKAFAERIEKDLGVKVILEDFAIADLRVSAVLEALQTGKSSNDRLEQLADALKQADVVVMSGSPFGSIPPDARKSIERCFSGLEPASCNSQDFEQYTANLETIWKIMFELREGKPTVLRGIDSASPFIGMWNKYQIYDACTKCWEAYSAASRQAAETFNIPFLSRYDAFNGLGHDEDLGQKGYLLNDGVHPNDLACQLTTELLSKMGYEPVPLP